MFQVQVNEKNQFQVSKEGHQVLLNGQAADFDVQPLPGGGFHVLYQNRSYRVEVQQGDQPKQYMLRINGHLYNVALKDQHDLLLDRLGLSHLAEKGAEDVKAPMPGLVLQVLVQPGDEVEKGTPLLILEAMKMENVIKATTAATVKGIEVEQGKPVEKGQLLVTFQ